MNRYNAELTTKINYSMIAMLPPLKLGLANYLKFYKVQSYTAGRLVIERR
jgi:hypothetical protein